MAGLNESTQNASEPVQGHAEIPWATHLEVYDKRGREMPGNAYDDAMEALKALGSFYHSGGWTDTNQRCVNFSVLADGSNIPTVKAGIETLLPFIKDAGRGRVLHIFEETLGDHGVYDLREKDGEWIVTKAYYGHETERFRSPLLDVALEYIRANHPAPDLNECDEDAALTKAGGPL